MTWLIFAVVAIALVYAIKSDNKRTEQEQAEAERKRGEEILRARAEREAKKQDAAPARKKAPSADGERHRVAGTSYRQKEIMTFASKNPDYDMTKKEIIDADMVDTAIYKYNFAPVSVTLEPEPDNPHDPKAIKVLFNGVHIGYIKSGSCTHVRKLMDADRIASISGRIYGGPSKMVCCYGDSPADAELEKSDGTIGADIRIFVNPEE